jgi:hypothetical protein
LSYYEDVSTTLDHSFTSILTTARLANSALRYLGALSAELQQFVRAQNVSSETNAMLRTCLADAMHLSASMQRCDTSFSHENFGVDSVTTTGSTSAADSVFLTPISTEVGNTCLAAVCEHNDAWQRTCGQDGFLGDLEKIAASHDVTGTQYAFSANRETSLHVAPQQLYTDPTDAATFAIMIEDLQTQEFGLLSRVSMWLDLQFNGMMVMVRKALNGGQFAQANDVETCRLAGMELDTVQWLSLAFEKCTGSMVRTWLKVTPTNQAYMHKLVETMDAKIQGVIKKGGVGTLFGGQISNMCYDLQDIEDDIKAEIEKLNKEHEMMHDGAGDPRKINTLYLSGVATVPDADVESFTKSTGPTQNWGPAADLMKVPAAFSGN